MKRSVLSLVLMFVVCGSASAVEHINNPATPRDGRSTLELQEAWRVGGEDGDTLFGLISSVATDRDGNVYILDSQQSQVAVYDRNGEFLRSVFREGDGPGEVRAPGDMMLMGDGRVGLVQEFPGAISIVDAHGNPEQRITVGGTSGGMNSLTACYASGDVILVSGTHQSQGATSNISLRENFLECIDSDGMTIGQFATNQTQYNFADFRFTERDHLPPFWWCFAASDDGTVYTTSDRDVYEITAHSTDGQLLRVFGREYEQVMRTDQEYDRLMGMVKSAMAGAPFQPTIVVEKSESVLSYLHRGLQIHSDGTLWALTGHGVRSRLTGVMVEFDVFDSDGVFVKQVGFEAPHEGQDVGVFLSGPDHVLVVLGYFESLAAQFGNGATFSGEDGEAAMPEVICYEILR